MCTVNICREEVFSWSWLHKLIQAQVHRDIEFGHLYLWIFQRRYLGLNLESTKLTEASISDWWMKLSTKILQIWNLRTLFQLSFLDNTVAQKGTRKSAFPPLKEIVLCCVDDSFQTKPGIYLLPWTAYLLQIHLWKQRVPLGLWFNTKACNTSI